MSPIPPSQTIHDFIGVGLQASADHSLSITLLSTSV